MKMKYLEKDHEKSFLCWRINVSDDDHSIDDEEYGCEELLRTIVRTTYLRYLRQSLRKNLEVQRCSTAAVEEKDVNKIVKNCGAILEEKALRKCMITKLYQRAMATMIKEIKQNTSDNKVFPILEEFIEAQKSSIPPTCDKSTQTIEESDKNNVIYRSDNILNVDASHAQALLQQIVLAATSTLASAQPVIDVKPLLSNNTVTNTHVQNNSQLLNCSSCDFTLDNQKTEKETHSSNAENITPVLPESENINIETNYVVKNEISNVSQPLKNEIDNPEFHEENNYLKPFCHLESTVNSQILDNGQPANTDVKSKYIVNVNGKTKEFTIKRKGENHTSSLDERLQALGLVTEESAIPSSYMEDNFVHSTNSDIITSSNQLHGNKNMSFEEKLKISTYTESIALLYTLECELVELPPVKRAKIEEEFVRLFGETHNNNFYNITEEQKSVACRKRVANLVVAELTPFYNRKQFASKSLFKSMAKYITSIILTHSLYPSAEDVKKYIGEFFPHDRIITSEADYEI